MTSLLAILTLSVTLASCAGYGGWWLGALRLWRRPDPLRWPYAVALGMGTLSYLVLAAGLLGLLQTWELGALVAAGGALLVPLLLSRKKDGAGEAPAASGGGGTEEQAPEQPIERYAALLVAAFVGLLALVTLLSALKPPDGLDWDGLSYHLAAPKVYLRLGRIARIDYDSHTDFPATMEMLYMVGLAFAGSAGAKLFHWAAGWLTALAVGAWAAQVNINGRAMPRWVGPAAAAAFASMPVVLWELGTAYIDLGTALFQFLAFTALVDGATRAAKSSSAATLLQPPASSLQLPASTPLQHPASNPLQPPASTLSPTLLAGILTGFALGTKYTALLQFGLLGLGLLGLVARSTPAARGAAWRSVFGFGAVSVLVAAPWYLKSWIWVNNPVYPFLYSLFPRSFSWTAECARAYPVEQHSFGIRYDALPVPRALEPAVGKGLELWNSLWNLALHGRAFYINLRTLTGDKLGSAGALWVGLLPLTLWCRDLGVRCRWCLAYAGASLVMWLFLSQQVRYLIPVFPVLAVVVAVLPVALPTRLLRECAGTFLGAVVVLSLWMHAPVFVPSLALATGAFPEQEYLAAQLPGLYEAAGFVNTLPPSARVGMYQETRGFYFDRDYVWANPLQNHLIPYERLTTGAELMEELRKLGITHVLVNYDFCEGVQTQQWYRLLMDAIRTRRLEEVFRSQGAIPERRGVMVYAIQ